MLEGKMNIIEQAMANQLSEVKFYPSQENIEIEEKDAIPLTQIAGLGAIFSPIVDSIKGLGVVDAGSKGLYRADVPEGMHMAFSSKKNAFIGSALSNETNKVAGQTGFTPVETVGNEVVQNMQASLNISLLGVAIILLSIEKKLVEIEEGQKKILDTITAKIRAEVEGHISFLNDVTKNYKFNWNNKEYKRITAGTVQQIRADSEQKIAFYQNDIADDVAKLEKECHDARLGMDIEEKSKKIMKKFQDLEMARYLYVFAYFVEIIIQGNYEKEYINNVVEKIHDYEIKNRELFTKVYVCLENETMEAIPYIIESGFASMMKDIGEFFKNEKIDFGKDLLEIGGDIEKDSEERRCKDIKDLKIRQEDVIYPFISSLTKLSKVFNGDTTLFFNNNNLYLK